MVEVRNRFKGLDLIDRMHDELWTEVCDIVQEAGIKTITMEKKCKKAKWLSGAASDSLWPPQTSPPGSSVPGIQARILEWVAIPFSRGSSWSRDPDPYLLRASPALAGGFFTTERPGKTNAWMPPNSYVKHLTFVLGDVLGSGAFRRRSWSIGSVLL